MHLEVRVGRGLEWKETGVSADLGTRASGIEETKLSENLVEISYFQK